MPIKNIPTEQEIHEAYLKWVHAFQVERMSQEDAFAAGFRFGVIKRDVEAEIAENARGVRR